MDAALAGEAGSATELLRLQFGLTASFHIIFPCLVLGLITYLLVLEILWLRTGREIYRRQYLFWVRIFAAAFIVAACTGMVLAFQIDTIFPGLYQSTEYLLLPIRRTEVLAAAFLEAGLFGVMVWGWERVGDRLHVAATAGVGLGALVTAVCILARNSWMQTPSGYAIELGQIVVDNWIDVVLSPSFPYRFLHMLGAAYASTAFFVLGVGAWMLLRGRGRVFASFNLRAATRVIAVLMPLQILSGDLHGLNTRVHQPVKLAAIEALWETTSGAPLVLFALPDQEREMNGHAIEIPKLASLIITHDVDGRIAGLKSVPRDERPNVALVFFSFRIMVLAGVAMAAVALVGNLLLHFGRLDDSRWFLRCCCAMLPSGFIATIAGWCVTEAGRQPWLLYGLLKTRESVVAMPPADALQMLGSLAFAYALISFVFIHQVCRAVR